MKKIFFRILSLVMVFSMVSGFDVFANEAVSGLIQIDVKEPKSVYVHGSVIMQNETSVTIQNPNDKADYPTVTLKVNEDTLIIDAATGEKRSFDNIKENDYLYTYASYAMTRSVIPQTNAYVIILNIPMGMAAPTYLEIENVIERENGRVTLETDRNIHLHLSEDTELFFYEKPEPASLEDIKSGGKIIAWYNMVMESFPAQANPTKVMILPFDYSGTIEKYENDEDEMIPLRKIAESLGYNVEWNDEMKTVNVSDENNSYLFKIGSNQVNKNGEIVEIQKAVELNSDYTYVSSNDFYGIIDSQIGE